MPAPAFHSRKVETAMILAAGLGTRMRPITDHTPKPLVEVAGRSLLDRALDAAVASGVRRAVVNVHHLADRIETHLATRADMETVVSDERNRLMDSGGGIAQALPLLGEAPFLILNADTFWREGEGRNIDRLAGAFDDRTDFALLLAGHDQAVGFAGSGDFFMDEDGRLSRRGAAARAPWIYAGAIVARPQVFERAPEGPFSINALFDRAIETGRMKGVPLRGLWLHVGTPDAIGEAELALDAFEAVA